jgi:histidinol dehydrogenase
VIKEIVVKSSEDIKIVAELKKRSEETALEVNSIVEGILKEVKTNGDKAIFSYTEKFDGVKLDSFSVKVSEEEFQEAFSLVDERLIEVIKKSASNIREFHENQKTKSWFINKDDGIMLGQIIRPIEKVGIYVPGGTAPLPSSVLMNAIPAKVAGVERIVMVTPPGRDGKINATILAAAWIAGVDEVYKVGGAQAIAALAYGTESVPKVDKITGPGNIFVATAKRLVFGEVGIDMVAGPSEILILADKSANPTYVAADMLSQAEHDKLASSVLVTDSRELLEEVKKELYVQLEKLPRKEIAGASLENYGAMILVPDMEMGIEIANLIAPEHLEVSTDKPFELVSYIKNAGAIFLGHYTPEPLGDYFAGPNHVLPTSGTARFYSPLNVDDFVKKSSLLSYSKKAFDKCAEDIAAFATAEGLNAHANSALIRIGKVK